MLVSAGFAYHFYNMVLSFLNRYGYYDEIPNYKTGGLPDVVYCTSGYLPETYFGYDPAYFYRRDTLVNYDLSNPKYKQVIENYVADAWRFALTNSTYKTGESRQTALSYLTAAKQTFLDEMATGPYHTGTELEDFVADCKVNFTRLCNMSRFTVIYMGNPSTCFRFSPEYSLSLSQASVEFGIFFC